MKITMIVPYSLGRGYVIVEPDDGVVLGFDPAASETMTVAMRERAKTDWAVPKAHEMERLDGACYQPAKPFSWLPYVEAWERDYCEKRKLWAVVGDELRSGTYNAEPRMIGPPPAVESVNRTVRKLFENRSRTVRQ